MAAEWTDEQVADVRDMGLRACLEAIELSAAEGIEYAIRLYRCAPCKALIVACLPVEDLRRKRCRCPQCGRRTARAAGPIRRVYSDYLDCHEEHISQMRAAPWN